MPKIAQYTNYLGQQVNMEFPDETPDAIMDAAVKREVQQSASTGRQAAGKMAAEGMGVGSRMLAGAGAGFKEVGEATGINYLARKLGANIDTTKESEDYEKGLGAAGKVGKFGTEVGITMLPAAKAASLARSGLGLAGRTLSPMGSAAVEGMVAGGMTNPEEQGKGIVAGGLGGAVGQKILGAILGRTAKPVPQAPGAEALRAEGVSVSAGQGAPGTIYSKIEEGLAGIPVLGRSLARSRELGRVQLRERALAQTLPEGGAVPRGPEGTTAESVALIKKQFGTMYEDALRGKKISIDEPFEEFVTKAVNDPSKYMRPDQRQFIESLLQKQVYSQVRNPAPAAVPGVGPGPVPGAPMLPQARGMVPQLPPPPAGTAVGRPMAEVGPAATPGPRPMRDFMDLPEPPKVGGSYLDAPTLFKAQSELRTKGRQLAGGTQSEKETGQTLKEISDEVYRMIGRQDEPAGAMIEKLRHPYGRLSAVEEAAAKAGGGGEFSPTQLRRASETSSKELNELAKKGEQFLKHEEPSGRPGWSAIAALLGGYMLGGPVVTGAGALAIPALGTKVVQRGLRGDYAAQKLLADALRKYPTTGGVSGGIAGSNLGEKR